MFASSSVLIPYLANHYRTQALVPIAMNGESTEQLRHQVDQLKRETRQNGKELFIVDIISSRVKSNECSSALVFLYFMLNLGTSKEH